MDRCLCSLPSFIDDLKSHVDIVQVVQERVPLRKSGVTWKGLCPFHGEKTPSFHVNGDKGFFHCFGCGVGGDVIKFVELYDKVDVPGRGPAARRARRADGAGGGGRAGRTRESQREREALLKVHEVAAAWFREQLAGAGRRARRRRLLARSRHDSPETIEQLGIGLRARRRRAARAADQGRLRRAAAARRAACSCSATSGPARDRFRNRLMIPICRDNGAIVAFGGRAMEEGQQPKYLNSPETADLRQGTDALRAATGARRRSAG